MIISEGINHGKLQSIIVGELKKAGLKHRLKKIILKTVKDNKTVFGAPLGKVPQCSVICCGSTLSIPVVVGEMSSVLRAQATMEGLFRKAGSQTRQKDIKRLLDAGGCVSDGHHPIDVASVLKLYLRCLPEPLISAEVQDLLLRCRLSSGDNCLKPILNTLLLLPVLHVHLLHYIMEVMSIITLFQLLSFIGSRHERNRMDSGNLAIVLAPSIMPLPAAASAQRLQHHVALVKLFIENAQHIGIIPEELMQRLDDDSDGGSRQRKKRRSGSLNRVLSGLRKMVSGAAHAAHGVAHTPARGKTPVLTKSAAKRKCADACEGLSAKTRKEIKECLPKELAFTPIKVGLERKRLRMSLVEGKGTPMPASDFSKNSDTSVSSEDLLTSTEHLFSPHDTIDLSADKQDKDYVKISKQEYEEIKSRVSAIETRLSREFTDVPPRVEPLQQVQNVYQQTLEDVSMLHCPASDHLARRLSKELKIRPSAEAKIIRSPSARKIGNIRRRSKENTKLVRHKSWNASTLSQASQNLDRFYPYMNIVQTANKDCQRVAKDEWKAVGEANEPSTKYQLRKRSSLAGDCNLNATAARPQTRRSFNVTNSSWEATASETSAGNTTLNSSIKSNDSVHQIHEMPKKRAITRKSPSQQKWKSAAAFFMDKTGELEVGGHSGRPSVNKLRRQNAGAVLAKAKMFETSSDKSSEHNERVVHNGFARKPRVSGQYATKVHRAPAKVTETACLKARAPDPPVPSRRRMNGYENVMKDGDDWRSHRVLPSPKKALSPQNRAPMLKKSLCTPRTLRAQMTNHEVRKPNTPMKAVHISPRRRSPRHKLQRQIQG